QPSPLPGPSTSFYPEGLAVHPTANQLAGAGGADQEGGLGDPKPPKKNSETPILGRSIWDVGLTQDGSRLCFRDQRSLDPDHPNRRGLQTVPYRVFDLQRRKFDANAKGVKPLPPVETMAGWKVVPDSNDRYVWRVENAQGKRFAIPLEPRDGMPRCYSFLKSASGDARLAVGHFWGVSIFELAETGPRRLRLFNGHQG